MQKLFVYSVHGTWAASDWYRTDSQFLTRLKDRLNQPAEIVEIGWSGRNRATARNECATKLKAAILENDKANPDSEHVVIAHSHGGNAAYRCLTRVVNKVKNVSIICMATTFIMSERRKARGPKTLRSFMNQQERASFFFLHLCFFLLMMFTVGNFIDSFREEGPLEKSWFFHVYNVMGGISFPTIMLLWSYIASTSDKNYKQILLDSRYRPVQVTDPMPRILVVRTIGDEASFLLTLMTILSKLIDIIYTGVLLGVAAIANWLLLPVLWPIAYYNFRTMPPLQAKVMRRTLLVTAVISYVLIGSLIWWLGGEEVMRIYMNVVKFIGCMYVLVIALFLVQLFYGWEYSFCCHFIRAFPESAPTTKINTSVAIVRSNVDGKGLRHGIYNQDECVEWIVTWINDRLPSGQMLVTSKRLLC